MSVFQTPDVWSCLDVAIYTWDKSLPRSPRSRNTLLQIIENSQFIKSESEPQAQIAAQSCESLVIALNKIFVGDRF